MNEEMKVIADFVKSSLSIDGGWWNDFLVGAALAEFSCDSYIVETTSYEQ